jgi:TP901 family phage tail tape measure protein
MGKAKSEMSGLGSIAKKAAAIAAAAWGALKIGQFIGDAVQVYSDFDQAMANTAAIAGATAEQYEQLEAAALAMGRKTTKSATECAEALGYMSLAGWDVKTSIQSLEPILRLSEATQMDLATCSDLVTDSMSALGLETSRLGEYLDVAAMANNKSNQTAQQLMEAYLGVGGTLKGLNVPLQTSATALGVLANRGIKGSEAGNALNAILVNLTTGTGQAGKMMEKLGISAFDSSGKFIGLEETLRLVMNATAGMTEEQRNAALAAIGGKQHIDALNALMAGLNATTADG